jgi:hypothetical protein
MKAEQACVGSASGVDSTTSFEKNHLRGTMPKRGLPVDRVWTIVKVSGEAYLLYIATDKIDQVMKDIEQKYQLVQIVGTLTSNKRSASGVVLQFLCDHPECELPYENVCAICSGPYKGLGNNAEPIESGRCCDKCNSSVIIARMMSLASSSSQS